MTSNLPCDLIFFSFGGSLVIGLLESHNMLLGFRVISFWAGVEPILLR